MTFKENSRNMYSLSIKINNVITIIFLNEESYKNNTVWKFRNFFATHILPEMICPITNVKNCHFRGLLLNSSKLISRKILVAVKFLNFHTVTIIYTLVVLEKIAFCPKMMIRFCEVCWMTDQLWKTQHSFCENAGFLS